MCEAGPQTMAAAVERDAASAILPEAQLPLDDYPAGLQYQQKHLLSLRDNTFLMKQKAITT